MRVYLAGPMAGLPGDNYAAFDAARDGLQAAGHDVVSPADVGRKLEEAWGGKEMFGRALPPDRRARMYMRHDLRELLTCAGVAVLPGWERATGAVFEVLTAQTCGLSLHEVARTGAWFLTPLELTRVEAARLYLEGRERKDTQPVLSAGHRMLYDKFKEEILKPEVSAKELVCAEADRLVDGARQSAYGHPADNYDRVATMWAGYLVAKFGDIGDAAHLSNADVVQMMMLLKMGRLMNGPHRDSVVDIAGYAKCLDMIHERKAP